MKQELVAQRDIQESDSQETTQQEDDSNHIATNEVFSAARYSAWIARVITDYSHEFGDTERAASNIGQALNLWRDSSIAEDDFVQLLHEAKQRMRKAQGGQGTGSITNRMAYFFRVLRQLATPGTD